MKKNYIIQDVNEPLRLICFDSLKSLKGYLKKFDYQFKELLDSRIYHIVSKGTIKDGIGQISYVEREIYVKEIETSRY